MTRRIASNTVSFARSVSLAMIVANSFITLFFHLPPHVPEFYAYVTTYKYQRLKHCPNILNR
jgi:hypothetical protein